MLDITLIPHVYSCINDLDLLFYVVTFLFF